MNQWYAVTEDTHSDRRWVWEEGRRGTIFVATDKATDEEVIQVAAVPELLAVLEAAERIWTKAPDPHGIAWADFYDAITAARAKLGPLSTDPIP